MILRAIEIEYEVSTCSYIASWCYDDGTTFTLHDENGNVVKWPESYFYDRMLAPGGELMQRMWKIEAGFAAAPIRKKMQTAS